MRLTLLIYVIPPSVLHYNPNSTLKCLQSSYIENDRPGSSYYRGLFPFAVPPNRCPESSLVLKNVTRTAKMMWEVY